MARRPFAPRYQRSLWDKLTKPDEKAGDGVGVSAKGELDRLRNSVRNDLEWLLNTRRSPMDIPDDLTALRASLVMYGLPDFSGVNPKSPHERDRLKKILEEEIAAFEPRLTSVKVSYDAVDAEKSKTTLHFRIEAMLRLDPTPEAIVFDTLLDLGNRVFTIKKDGV